MSHTGGLGVHGFPGLLDRLMTFPKPLICAVNGLALGIGVTILGHADLAFMADDARLKCPFTSLGVAPEAASSYLFPLLVGRMDATWILLSSEWVDAAEAREMGLVWRVVEPTRLMEVALEHARTLARRPISSLVETKRLMVEPYAEAVADARRREDAAFGRLLDGPANREAIAAFLEGREPDFAGLGGD